MSNREQYKKAFSVLQASGDFTLGDEKMAVLKKKAMLRTFAAAACACLVIVGSSRIAYAANVGGIQRTIQLWMYGDQTDVTIDFDGSGNYSMEYTDADGNTRELGGGGFDVDADGTKRALTEDELIWHLFEEVDVLWSNQCPVGEHCYIFLNGTDLNGTDASLYVTVLKAEDGGFPIDSSPDRYLQYKETEPGIYTVY